MHASKKKLNIKVQVEKDTLKLCLAEKEYFSNSFSALPFMITRQPETPLTNLAQPQLCLWVVLGVAPTSGLHLAFSR